MGDMGDAWRDIREQRRQRLLTEGVDCPMCRITQPKRTPTRLLPGWECKVCRWRRPRYGGHRMLAENEAVAEGERLAGVAP